MYAKKCQASFCQAAASHKVSYADSSTEWFCAIHTGYMISSFTGHTIAKIERIQDPIREVCMEQGCGNIPLYSVTLKSAFGPFHYCDKHAIACVYNHSSKGDFVKMEPYNGK